MCEREGEGETGREKGERETPSPSQASTLSYTQTCACLTPYHVEVAGVSRGHIVPAAARGPHGRHKEAVVHAAEGVVAGKPASVVHVLAQQLDGRLGAIRLQLHQG